jgi:hypothetical protein
LPPAACYQQFNSDGSRHDLVAGGNVSLALWPAVVMLVWAQAVAARRFPPLTFGCVHFFSAGCAPSSM